jgi:hypothetical protein
VLYDSDETSRIGLECAALFLQKGFTNIFLLTGGLKHFAAKYWDRCTGEQPPGPPPAAPSTGRGGAAGGSVSMRGQALAGTPASSRPMTGASSRLNTGRAGAGGGAGASASAAAAAPASFRPHMPAQYSSSGFQGANPATSLSARPQHQQQPPQQGRISPRDSLARSQQQGVTGYSQRHVPETPASQRGAGHARGGSGSSASSGSAQISSRAFR